MTHCCWQWPNTAVSISWPCSVKFGQSWLVSCAYSVRNCIASQVLHATTVDGTCCDRDIMLLNMLRQVSTQPSQWDTVSKPSSDTAKLPSPNINSRWLELTTPYVAPARNNEMNINCYLQIIMMTTQDNLHALWCASRDTHTNSMTQSATTSLLWLHEVCDYLWLQSGACTDEGQEQEWKTEAGPETQCQDHTPRTFIWPCLCKTCFDTGIPH